MLVIFFLLLKFSIWGIKFRLLKFHEDFYSRVFNIAIFYNCEKREIKYQQGT